MSEEQPYSNNSWDDLPLPDSDQSWQAMKALLDKEDERRRPLLPPFFTSCAGWSVLAGAGLLLGALFFAPSHWFSGKKEPATAASRTATEPSTITTKSGSNALPNSVLNKESKTVKAKLTEININHSLAETVQKPANHSVANQEIAYHKTIAIKEEKPTAKKTPFKHKTREWAKQPIVASIPITNTEKERRNKESQEKVAPFPVDISKNDSNAATTMGLKASKDSNAVAITKITPTDSLQANEPAVVDSIASKTSGTKRLLSFSGGVGFQQQIPSSDQVAYSKGYNGKGALGDYIPSVYGRVQYKGWFLQAEARFGAPQSVTDFAYSRQSRYDTAAGKLDVTSQRLKKVYYHQFPLSLNYNITSHWSVGAGAVFNRFYRAVSEQQVASQNLSTGIESLAATTQRISGFRDSFLYKTGWQWLLQTEYSIGRLSLGLRYKRDAQPFIRYTLPTGVVVDGKGEAMEAVLRWRLWKGRK